MDESDAFRSRSSSLSIGCPATQPSFTTRLFLRWLIFRVCFLRESPTPFPLRSANWASLAAFSALSRSCFAAASSSAERCPPINPQISQSVVVRQLIPAALKTQGVSHAISHYITLHL